ncbi:hypothetical protein INR49_023188 [Caranx melampygus]|nr:hypothetical protein INR49_023188 [Caranx melampygus]
MSSREVKEYLSHHLVPQLLELGGPEAVSWDTFIHLDRDLLRPGLPGTTSMTTPLDPTTLPISPHVSLLAPISLPITPPPTTASTVAPLTSSTPVVAPPPVSSGPPKMNRVLHLTPPGPAGALPPRPPPPLVQTEVKDEDNSEALPPPGLSRSPVLSQLSIESDSDMTESSGLLQEVSILHPRRSRPLIIFIIGGPGSGKRSQTARLVHCFGLRAISLGDLLRKKLLSHASPSRKWEVISEMMSHGELGPQIGSPDLVMLLLCSNETLSCRLQQRASRLGLLGDSSHTLRRRLDTFQRDVVSVRRYYSQTHLLTQIQLVSQNAPVKSMMFNIRSDQL